MGVSVVGAMGEPIRVKMMNPRTRTVPKVKVFTTIAYVFIAFCQVRNPWSSTGSSLPWRSTERTRIPNAIDYVILRSVI